MRPFLRHRSSADHKDLIRILNRCQPVGNRDDCLPMGQFGYGFLNQMLILAFVFPLSITHLFPLFPRMPVLSSNDAYLE